MKGFVLVLLVEASQAADDHDAIARVCHDFDAATIADLEVAIEHASRSAKRQLRNAGDAFKRERETAQRRAAIRPV